MRSSRLGELAGSTAVSDRYRPSTPIAHRPAPSTSKIAARISSGMNWSVAALTHDGTTTVR